MTNLQSIVLTHLSPRSRKLAGRKGLARLRSALIAEAKDELVDLMIEDASDNDCDPIEVAA